MEASKNRMVLLQQILNGDVECDEVHVCKLAEGAADLAVAKTFAILGVDVNNPSEVEQFRMDLRFGSELRKTARWGKIAIATSIVTVVVGGILSSFWTGFVDAIMKMKGH